MKFCGKDSEWQSHLPDSDSIRIVAITNFPYARSNFGYAHLPHVLIDVVASYHGIYSEFKHLHLR